MFDSDPNSVEDLEEVTPDDFDWPMPPRSASDQQGGSGRRGRKSATSGSVIGAECLVCRLSASGNNFGVATCESCKTFFRRNAKRELSQIRCLHYNNCNVLREFRRSCTACRLRKCFSVGMRKDLILSDEKLRTRARPTFKKPRYRWCRVPASVDIEQLLFALQAGAGGGSSGSGSGSGGPPVEVRVKTEAADDALTDEAAQSPAPSELDCSTPGDPQFESSPACQRLVACVLNYELPYDPRTASCLLVRILKLEDGFTTMDSPIRKMIRFVPELPHFDQLEKVLLGRLIKLKVFGALQIVSIINYDSARDALVFRMDNGCADAVVPARDGIFGTFLGLTKLRLLDGRALYSPGDIERMYTTLTGFYRDMERLFGERRKLAAVVLMALYLLEEDAPLALTDAERSLVRQVQWHYLGYLDDIAGLRESEPSAAAYASKKALLLLVQIRWLDTCYADASKTLQLSRVPPLMQELVTD